MFGIYLTPISISYLTQFILSAGISVLMIQHLRMPINRLTRSFLLTWFMAFITVFIGLLFFESATLSVPRIIFTYLENPFLAVALVFLLQFAYRFPVLRIRRRWEGIVFLGLSLAYALGETGFAIYRIARLQVGEIMFREAFADYALLMLLTWIPIVFLYRYIVLITSSSLGLRHKLAELLNFIDPVAAEERRAFVQAFLRPLTPETRALRIFIISAVVLPAVGILDILSGYNLISASIGSLGIAIGTLLGLFIFSMAYLNYQKNGVSVMVKLAITGLSIVLALMASIGWVLSPVIYHQFHSKLPDPGTLRFVPNEFGGYDVTRVASSYQNDLGVSYPLGGHGQPTCQPLDFEFTFYRKPYTHLFACKDGAISLGGPLIFRNIQNNYGGGLPLILPLLTRLVPEGQPGGIFVQQKPERLVISWHKQHGFYRPQAEFTFQVVLQRDGVFEFNYKGLPGDEDTLLDFQPGDEPGTNVWLFGALPGITGTQSPQSASMTDNLPLRTGSSGVVQDYLLEFRMQVNQYYQFLAWLILFAGVVISIGFPFLIYFNLIKPINNLVNGVRQIDKGNLQVQVPIYYNDEIGFLTETFNKMALWLHSLVTNLEERVAARTLELADANQKLSDEMEALAEAQSLVLNQQRQVAVMEERDRMARDLHDGLGQVLASINIQTQAVQVFLANGDQEAAETNLKSVVELSQDASINIRGYILGLHKAFSESKNLAETLQLYLNVFSAETGIKAFLDWPASLPSPIFPPSIEEQVLHILQEALTNIRKHAHARRVEVIFSFDTHQVQVMVLDDGIGFDIQSPAPDAVLHFGLSILRERAEMIGARLEIRSSPGQGTKILLFIPRLVDTDPGEPGMSTIHGLRLLLVDDSPIFLEGMRSLLMSRGLLVLGVANNGLQALEKTRLLRPDVVIMDVNMPVSSGLDGLRLIKQEFPDVRVLMLSIMEDDNVLFEALKSGASGYMLKSLNVNEFCNLLAGLVRGLAPLSPSLATRLLNEFTNQPVFEDVPGEGTRRSDQELSVRQRQILELLVGNLSYKEVAVALNVSESTVKYHMGQILERLHLLNRAEAVAYARRLRKQK